MMVPALEVVRYAPEAQYNLIFNGCLTQRDAESKQRRVVMVCQGDMIILKEEKCGGIYKLKEGNSVPGGVSITSVERSSLQGEASKKTTRDVKQVKMLQEKECAHSGKA